MAPLNERNPRVVFATKLQRAAQRRKTGLFLAEGANAVDAALATGQARELFLSPAGVERESALVTRAEAAGIPSTVVSERAARALGETITPPGVVAVCAQRGGELADLLATKPRILAIPVQMSDPGNAGTLIRVADAMGADGVILAGDSVDPYNGKCVRASAGSLFHIPVLRQREPAAVLNLVREQGITLLATTTDGDTSIADAAEIFTGPVAWLFGNEAHGLAPEIAALADRRIRIPIRGRAESLNLATAAAICLYENSRGHDQ